MHERNHRKRSLSSPVSPPPPASEHPFTHSTTAALSGSPLPLARHFLPSIIEPTSTNDASIAGLISCSSIVLFSAFSKQQLISVGNRISISRRSLKYSNGIVHSCCKIVGLCPVCRTACDQNIRVSGCRKRKRKNSYLVLRIRESEKSKQPDDLMSQTFVLLPVTAIPQQIAGNVAQLQRQAF